LARQKRERDRSIKTVFVQILDESGTRVNGRAFMDLLAAQRRKRVKIPCLRFGLTTIEIRSTPAAFFSPQA
jgi:hypothetical protein